MTILWTVVPPEALWDEDSPPGDTPAPLVEVSHGGVSLLARRTAGGMMVERLLTTDPYAYLRPDLAPGALLDSPIRA